MRDTTPEAEAFRRQRLQKMTPGERIEEGLRAAVTCRHIIRGGIRTRHPEYSEEEVEDALARILWGDELFVAARPGRPLRDP